MKRTGGSAETAAGKRLPPYRQSLAGTLLAARESVMTPLRPMLRDAGVTEQQWRVLRVLVDEGAIDVSRLAAAAMLLPPSVSRILRELTGRGLIARRADAADRRKFIVEVSEAGRRLLDDTALRTLQVLDRYGEAFGPDRLAHLKTELRAFTIALQELQGDGMPAEGEAEEG